MNGHSLFCLPSDLELFSGADTLCSVCLVIWNFFSGAENRRTAQTSSLILFCLPSDLELFSGAENLGLLFDLFLSQIQLIFLFFSRLLVPILSERSTIVVFPWHPKSQLRRWRRLITPETVNFKYLVHQPIFFRNSYLYRLVT